MTPWTADNQASLSITNSRSLLKFMSIESMDEIQPSHPLSFPSPPAFNLSQHQGLFQRVSSSHQVASFGGFSFSMSSFNEYSGLISFRIDWFDLFEVQGNLKSILQHYSSKELILRHSAFFMYGPILTSIHDYWKNKFLKINILSTRLTKTIKIENIK